jgi:hypothetical protein
MLNLKRLFGREAKTTENFFSLSAREKRKMIKASAIKSNELQAELVAKYNLSYSRS